MPDFYQGSSITTIHRHVPGNTEHLERTLLQYADSHPVALVVPALWADLQAPAAQAILETLREVPYLREIVISLGGANAAQFEEAKRMLAALPQETHLIWNDGPGMQQLYGRLAEEVLPAPLEDGKGRSAWIAYGLLLALGNSHVITLHDSDILTYDREFLARLVYPVAVPTFSYIFCKGFYSRISEGRLKGRVTRLFVFPLVRALRRILGPVPFLDFLGDFRYPLAGEFAMVAELAFTNRIPSDWGLEVGVLAEVFRNVSPRRVCQVELCENYDHKHQGLDPQRPDTGLLKMSVDIAKSIFRTLAAEGVVLDEAFFKGLRATYTRTAEDIIKNFSADAQIDGLAFDRHEEELAVESFCGGLAIAGEEFYRDPMGRPLIPNWSRIVSAVPDFFQRLVAVVREDRAERRA